MLCTTDDDEVSEMYTIEEAVDKIGFGVFQVLISLYSGAVSVNNSWTPRPRELQDLVTPMAQGYRILSSARVLLRARRGFTKSCSFRWSQCPTYIYYTNTRIPSKLHEEIEGAFSAKFIVLKLSTHKNNL